MPTGTSNTAAGWRTGAGAAAGSGPQAGTNDNGQADVTSPGWTAASTAPVARGPAPTPNDVETVWPAADLNPSLQAVLRDVASHTDAQLGTSRERRVLCGPANTPDTARARARAAQLILRSLHPLLSRRVAEMTAAEPTLRTLVDASEALLSAANPSVPRVTDGLMWALAEAYAQAVCATDADVPALATAAIAAVNEDPFVRSQLTNLFTSPIVPAAVPGRYWTKRDDLVGPSSGALAARAPAQAGSSAPRNPYAEDELVDDWAAQGAFTLAQVRVDGGPFTCAPSALRAFDRGGLNDDNGVHEAGEVLGVTLHCRNTSSQRLLSQSLVLATSGPADIVLAHEEVVVPEAAPGDTFDVTLGPIYVASSAGARPSPLPLRVVSSRGLPEGTIEVRFQPLVVSVLEVGFTAPDEDLPGASTQDDNAAFGPDDRFEMLVRTRVPAEFTPSIEGVALAHTPDAAIFELGSLATPDVTSDSAGDPGVFFTVDDLDGRVASRDVCAGLDVRSPLALTRVPGRRFAKVNISLAVASPITLAQIASRLAPVSFYAAATTLGQQQGVSTNAAWNALRSAGGQLEPALALLERWEAESERSRTTPPPLPDPSVVVTRVTEALDLLAQSRVIDAATHRALLAMFPPPCPSSEAPSACGAPRSNVRVDPGTLSRFMLLCHALGQRDANSECESLLRAMATPAPEVSTEQFESRLPLARRLLKWSMLASAFGENAWKILAGIDVRTSDPEAFLSNERALRNALAASVDEPLNAASPPVSPAILRALALAATTPIPELPTWSLSRFVSLPLE